MILADDVGPNSGPDLDKVTNLAFAPDGQTLAVGNIDGNVLLWQVSDGALYQTLNAGSVLCKV